MQITKYVIFSYTMIVSAFFWSSGSSGLDLPSSRSAPEGSEVAPDDQDAIEEGPIEEGAVDAESPDEEQEGDAENDAMENSEGEGGAHEENADGGLLDAAAGKGVGNDKKLNIIETLEHDNALQTLVSNGNMIIIKPVGAQLLDSEKRKQLSHDAIALRTVHINENGELLDSNSNKIKDKDDKVINESDLKDGEKIETDTGNTVEKAEDGDVVIEQGTGDGSAPAEEDETDNDEDEDEDEENENGSEEENEERGENEDEKDADDGD